ncbi:FtsX-like permease family protein [Acidobacteria bacterium AB60]|nr:FtsX-like permease family protein [Acidobacteria bacterium AB60]
MRTVLQDLRYAARQLSKMPGFSLTAIISLVLGIGATTAVFSVVYAIVFDPYPYANSDRMVHMRMLQQDGQNRGFGLTGGQWQKIRQSPVVEDAFLTDGTWSLTMTSGDLPENVETDYVSTNMFSFMGVPAFAGRNIQPSDGIDGQDPQPVVELSYKFWQRHFNGDTSVIGKQIKLLQNTYTVVGVAPPRFTWDDADAYVPKKITQQTALSYYVGVRLKPGVTHAQANSALSPLIEQFRKETPTHFPQGNFRFTVVGLNDDFMHDIGGTLYLMFGSVALLLLIGCGNVSILLLARATARRSEFGVRSAVGASRSRIVRQLLTEALLLSLTGAALGVLLAWKAIGVIVANLPEFSFPHEAAIHLNIPVLLFSVCVAVGTGILFGLWPALELSKPDIAKAIQANSRKTTTGVRGKKLHASLIAGQIALTLLLLAGAGAAIEGFLKLANRPLGYDPHNVMSVGIPIHEGTHTKWSERAPYVEKIFEAIRQVPGVSTAAVSLNATPPENGFQTRFEVVGKPSQESLSTRVNMVSPEYFSLLGVPLLQGRLWDADENHQGAALTVINQTFAKRYFPNGDAIGHSIKLPEATEVPPYRLVSPAASGPVLIVGIVRDKLDDGMARPIVPEAFVPYPFVMGMYAQVLVKSQESPMRLLHAIQEGVGSVDHTQQTNPRVRDLDHWIQETPEWARGHLVAWLFGGFAGLALALAAVGLYSVVSYTVAQRTNELGVRLALGAPRLHILQLVLRAMAGAVGMGTALGLTLSFALSHLMSRWSPESQASSRDPLLMLVAASTLIFVVLLASAIPAKRAAATDPLVAIRYE